MAGAKTRIHSNVATIKRGLEGEIAKRLRKVGVAVASQTRRNISISTRANGPSQVGGFPHADTGTLRKSVTDSMDTARLEVHVGTTTEYGPFLEDGGRSFLERTAREMAPFVKRVMTSPIKLGSRGGPDVAAAITEGDGD